jgi:hypothetical protein
MTSSYVLTSDVALILQFQSGGLQRDVGEPNSGSKHEHVEEASERREGENEKLVML